jgi:glycosyltransferase involved in cell wall biosynthesis
MSLSRPIISVVVPIYNAVQFLPRCLESIRAAVGGLPVADRSGVEIVVCDNASSDGSFELAHGFDFGCASRVIQPPEHYPNRTKNWHHGLAAGDGEWLVMLHADDLFAPTSLAAMLAACRSNAAVGSVMICGRHRVFTDHSEPGGLRPVWPFPVVFDGGGFLRQVAYYFCSFVPFVLMRRDAYAAVGGLDPAYELTQDWDLWIRLLATGDLLWSAGEFGRWRSHDYSPSARRVNASDNLTLAHSIRTWIKDLSPRKAAWAMDVSIARSVHWLPDCHPADIVADPRAADAVRSRPLPTSDEAESVLKTANRSVRLRLAAMRVVGTIRWAVRAVRRRENPKLDRQVVSRW